MFMYKTKIGSFVSKLDVENSFLMVYGHYPSDFEYSNFLSDIWGRYIVEAVDYSWKDFAKCGEKIDAVKAYKMENDCGVRESYEAVTKFMNG